MGQLGTVMGLRSNGEEFPIEAAISHIAVGGKKYHTVILRDITERKRAEDSHRESQRQLTTLIGNLPGFVYRCRNDHGWIFEYLSEGVSDLTGYTVEEYLIQRTTSYGENIHPGDRERVRHEVQAAFEEHRPFELTYRILTKCGEVKWVWERGEGIYAQDGTLSYLEGFVTDVTERKRAEHLLRQSEERYRRLIAVSPYAILVDRGDRVIFANDQAIKLFGAVKAEEILEKSPMDLFHADDRHIVRERIHERSQLTHLSARRARLSECMNVVTMSITETSRQESVERLPNGFSSRAAEHLLRRVIKQHHSLVLIHGDDRIHRSFNDAFQPEPADQELFFRLLAGD